MIQLFCILADVFCISCIITTTMIVINIDSLGGRECSGARNVIFHDSQIDKIDKWCFNCNDSESINQSLQNQFVNNKQYKKRKFNLFSILFLICEEEQVITGYRTKKGKYKNYLEK